MTGFFVGDPVPTDRRITKLAFKQRMTQAERIAIRTAAATNPVVFDFQDLLDSAEYIDLSRGDTISNVTTLESVGLLAEGRAVQILNAPIQDIERLSV